MDNNISQRFKMLGREVVAYENRKLGEKNQPQLMILPHTLYFLKPGWDVQCVSFCVLQLKSYVLHLLMGN